MSLGGQGGQGGSGSLGWSERSGVYICFNRSTVQPIFNQLNQ